ncbi:MAG: N-acetyltransferase [Frankiales bacterium]|nr:N-acetyltransferase [Frankiales bacterium]
MTTAPGSGPLLGRHVRLDRSVPGDGPGLLTALDDERVWENGYGGGPAGRARVAQDWVNRIRAAEDDSRAMYTVRLVHDGAIVGTSSLGDVDLLNERIHLGWTAYSPSHWSSVVNPECKLLLLGHAFDECGFGRVKIQTDLINTRSQAAIAKLGAVREGVLRRHVRRADGSWRDTVVFSVIIDEWPAVKTAVQPRLLVLSVREGARPPPRTDNSRVGG